MTQPSEDVVRIDERDGAAHLSLQGVVDLFAVSTLRDLLSREVGRGRALFIECKELERIDASVLQLLLALERAVRERGTELALRDVPDNVSRYLDIAGADVLLSRRSRSDPGAALNERTLAAAPDERAAPTSEVLTP